MSISIRTKLQKQATRNGVNLGEKLDFIFEELDEKKSNNNNEEINNNNDLSSLNELNSSNQSFELQEHRKDFAKTHVKGKNDNNNSLVMKSNSLLSQASLIGFNRPKVTKEDPDCNNIGSITSVKIGAKVMHSFD